MNFIQKIEIFENEKHRADKEFDSPLKIALLVFGLPGLVMLLIMCLILPSKIEYVAKGEPVKAELISVSVEISCSASCVVSAWARNSVTRAKVSFSCLA